MRIVLIILIFCIFNVPVYATSDQPPAKDKLSSYEEYVPDEMKNLLSASGIDSADDFEISELLNILSDSIKTEFDASFNMFTNLIAIILIVSVFKRLNDNDSVLLTSFAPIIASSFVLMAAFNDLNNDIVSTLEANVELLYAILPSFSSVVLLGGGSASVSSIGASFSIIISLLNVFISEIVSGFTAIIFVLVIFEKISPAFNGMKLTKQIKKYTLLCISFITTLLITVLSFQNILSSRADSVGIRTVKFASSSFIPIIGASVGEAIKTLSANIGYLKGTLGLSVILSFIVIYAPTLVHVLIVKLFLSICSLVSGACECQDEGALIDGVVDVVDIMLSIIICSMILSLLLVIFFVFVTFGV